jgi:hypothetical protein
MQRLANGLNMNSRRGVAGQKLLKFPTCDSLGALFRRTGQRSHERLRLGSDVFWESFVGAPLVPGHRAGVDALPPMR